MATTIPPPFEGIRTIQRPQARDSGWRQPSRLQSRPITCPWGSREKTFRRGHWNPPVLDEVLHESSTRCAFHKRERVPAGIFSPGFPTRDNQKSGTEDSQSPSHHPEPRPSRRRSHPPCLFPQSLLRLLAVYIIFTLKTFLKLFGEARRLYK